MRWLLPLAATILAAPAASEVTGRNDTGFTAAGIVSFSAAPDRVWAALVKPAGWWNPDHTWSGNVSNLTLEPRAGGCFCEALTHGGSVEHMRVIYADPGHRLRMSGALGPLQSEGLAATLTVALEPAAKGTRLAWSYKVGGYTDLPLPQIAPAVDGVLTEQFARLRGRVDRGSPGSN